MTQLISNNNDHHIIIVIILIITTPTTITLTVTISIITIIILEQDKGGPSKCGFLNNRLFSYTDLYSCNTINGVCVYIYIYIYMTYHSGKSYIIQKPPLLGPPSSLPE